MKIKTGAYWVDKDGIEHREPERTLDVEDDFFEAIASQVTGSADFILVGRDALEMIRRARGD